MPFAHGRAENYRSAAKIFPTAATASPAGGGEQRVGMNDIPFITEPAYNLQVVPNQALMTVFVITPEQPDKCKLSSRIDHCNL
jgi:hypothetical protein